MNAGFSGLSVDLDALAANFETLKAKAGGAQVAPAVKANGYGLGAIPVAQRLWAHGARAFYVARLAEGQKLRAALPDATIYVLDGATPTACAQLVDARLTPVLSSLEQVGRWAAKGAGPAVLHVDTGMNRLGLRPSDLGQVRGVEISLIISHLACAGEPDHPLNAAQRARFVEAAAQFPDAARSLSGSGGIYLGPDYHFDQVRPGISLYGGGPEDQTHPDIAPVATLNVPILQVRMVPAGESVGYGAAFTAPNPTRVGIIAAGYADGVLRSMGGRGQVWFGGALRPMLGRVSMDLIAIDLGDAAAAEGDLVELIGPHNLVDQAAAWAGTNAYEVLTRLGTRVEHRYLSRTAV